jgi:CO dehydrogenase/acetyl-CoA synthase beta subunit
VPKRGRTATGKARAKEAEVLAERTSRLKQSLKEKGGDPLRSKSLTGPGAKGRKAAAREEEEDDMPPMEQTQEEEAEGEEEEEEEERPARTRGSKRAEAPTTHGPVIKEEPQSASRWRGRLRMNDPRCAYVHTRCLNLNRSRVCVCTCMC